MYVSTVQAVDPDSEDEVTFVACTTKSIVVVDASGAQLSAEGGITAGSIIAVRVDGVWRLRDLTRTSAEMCPSPGAQR